jgi:hypothetical protein
MFLRGAGQALGRHSNTSVNSVHVRAFELKTCTSLTGLPCNYAQMIISEHLHNFELQDMHVKSKTN